jgi:V/A-type H+-transporting ATPase subunit A
LDGSVTIVGAVSPPGGDMTEPVTAHTQRFVRALWTLDRELAYARHYPAVAWIGSYCRDVDAVGTWYGANGDLSWASRRGRMVSVLAEADRLAALAELVGLAALPGHERMLMLSGKLLREAVLQQSALSANDGYCTPAKTAALIDMVFEVMARCEELVESGVAAETVEELDFARLIRAREETGPDDANAVRRRMRGVLETLGALS